VEDGIHYTKDEMQRFEGKGLKSGPDVVVDPTTGEIYLQTSNGGLGDSLGDINDPIQ
jgi:hypothetical protein